MDNAPRCEAARMDAVVERVSRAPVRMVRISGIDVGLRRRRKHGDLRSLVMSISARGLIHPILLRGAAKGRYELAAGERRLLACQELGWAEIPARLVEELTDEDFRLLELEENIARLDLSPQEASAARGAEMKAGEGHSQEPEWQ